MLSLSIAPNETLTYAQIGKAIELQLRCLDMDLAATIGTEGFSDFVHRAFIAVVDTFTQLLMTLKTNVTAFADSLKRSEIKVYSDSNMLKISAVEKKGYHECKDMDIDFPSGMHGTYIEGVVAVKNVYTTLRLRELITTVSHELDRMYQAMSRGEDYSVPFNTMVRHFADTKDHVVKALELSNKIFTKDSTNKAKFEVLYKSMEQFRMVRTELVGMEKYPKDVAEFVSAMEDMDKVLKNIVSFIGSSKDKMDDATVKSLASFVRILADYYEIYGTNVSRQLALEHNHVLVIDALYEVQPA